MQVALITGGLSTRWHNPGNLNSVTLVVRPKRGQAEAIRPRSVHQYVSRHRSRQRRIAPWITINSVTLVVRPKRGQAEAIRPRSVHQYVSRHRSRQRRIAPWITIKVMLFGGDQIQLRVYRKLRLGKKSAAAARVALRAPLPSAPTLFVPPTTAGTRPAQKQTPAARPPGTRG